MVPRTKIPLAVVAAVSCSSSWTLAGILVLLLLLPVV